MDDDQQFCLRWNNHQTTLISVFDTLLESGTLVDCTLAAEGKFLKAHKVVLSACSPYFEALLSQQYDKHPIFILKDVKFQELRAMMDYMYRGEVNISQDQLAALLKAAESLQIKGLTDSRSDSVPNKTDNIVKHPPPPPVPAALKGGLTISDAKRKQLLGGDLDTDLSMVSREGSTSPSRKRKKIGRRRSIGTNNVLDNHEQHSNSSSHSHTTPHIAAAVGAIAAGNVTNNIATSTPNVLPVTKKTDHDQNKTADAAGIDSANDTANDEQQTAPRKDKRNTDGNETHSELMIEPKNEYDDDDDEEGPVEDLTLDDEDMLDDMDQAGPSHGGEGSSSGYGNWQMERSQDEGFMVGQDGGQPRDAQGGAGQIIYNHHGFEYKDIWYNLKFSDLSRLINGEGRYGCPRANCAKTYKDASSLQRHIRYECGGMKKFRCIMCGKAFSQGSHLKRHLESGVCIKYYF